MEKEKNIVPPGSNHSKSEQQVARNLWVMAVLGFWITVAVTLTVYLLRGELNLILLSVALGTLILGVWLKTRYQLLLRKQLDPPDKDEKQRS